jgi:bacterial/archaeal transporter family-2 protein
MSGWLALGFLAGMANAVQGAVNAQLRAAVRDPLWATLLSFLVGTAALVLLIVVTRAPAPAHLPSRPVVWTGGLLGVLFVCAAIVLVPRIGAGTMIGLMVAGQMAAALLLDQFGLLGVPEHPTTPARFFGAILVVVGVLLLRRA